MDYSKNLKLGERGAWLSIIAYSFLSIIKLTIAYIGASEALRADGLNNTTDVIASIAILIGLKISRKPPDHNHQYGHYRAESIASLFASFIMITIGIQVVIGTFQKLIANEVVQPNLLTAWTALGAALVMLVVYRYNLILSRKIKSSAIYAAAQDNRSDALVSIGVFIGIIGAQMGLYWLDPLAGIVVGFIICKTAWDIFREASLTLTDAFDNDKIEQVKETVKANPNVIQVKDIKGRIHGNQSFIDIIILVDPNLTVKEAHDITINIERLLAEEHNIFYTHIHIEPAKKD